MKELPVRKSVHGYVRDSYLGLSARYNDAYRLIDCAIGCSQWGVSPLAIEAHARHSPETLARYPEPGHETLLKPAILRRFGLESDASPHLFLGHGSFNLAERLIHKLIEPGIMIGVGPQFNEIPTEFVAAGGTYRPIPMKGPSYVFPMAQVIAALNQGASVLYIDNPNNPTGQCLDLSIIEELVRTAEICGAIVIIDEAYGDFVEDSQSAVHLVSRHSNLAVLRSFSKALGLAAARVGYMFVSKDIARYYQNLDVPFEPSLHSAELARATLEDTTFLEHVRASAIKAKRRLVPVLESSGFTVLPTHPATSILSVHKNGADLVSIFASMGVSVEPGSAFQKTNPDWNDSYCRLRLPPEDDCAELERRLTLISKEVISPCS